MGGRGGGGGDGGGGSDAAVELELGLGLSLGGGGSTWGECRRILTASDFPTVGSKRAAESGVSPPRSSQVVGWPPIGIHRMNSLINQSKTLRSEGDDEHEFKPENRSKNKQDNEDEDGDEDEGEDEGDPRKFGDVSSSKKPNQRGKGKLNSGFVKVNLDGIPIGRKVDLNVHASYETLATALEDMFFRSTSTNINSIGSCSEKEKLKQSMLLDGSSDFVLTYEDKEGDWMLVGDVPWRMFLGSVRRLRIIRTSEANGLGFSAPRFHEPKQGQRKRTV